MKFSEKLKQMDLYVGAFMFGSAAMCGALSYLELKHDAPKLGIATGIAGLWLAYQGITAVSNAFNPLVQYERQKLDRFINLEDKVNDTEQNL